MNVADAGIGRRGCDQQLVRRALRAVARFDRSRLQCAVRGCRRAAEDCPAGHRRERSARPRERAGRDLRDRADRRGRWAARRRTQPACRRPSPTRPRVPGGRCPSAVGSRSSVRLDRHCVALVRERHMVARQEPVRGGAVAEVHFGVHARVAAVAGLRVYPLAVWRERARAGGAAGTRRRLRAKPAAGGVAVPEAISVEAAPGAAEVPGATSVGALEGLAGAGEASASAAAVIPSAIQAGLSMNRRIARRRARAIPVAGACDAALLRRPVRAGGLASTSPGHLERYSASGSPIGGAVVGRRVLALGQLLASRLRRRRRPASSASSA